jgi:dTDP-4-dehydrorhamnose 3,5-epimerase
LKLAVDFRETPLAGAFLVELERRVDERGFFARTFCERELEERELPSHWPQCSLARNVRAGTLRGLHYNAAPFQEAKLVRCVAGAIWDVIVDLRRDSPCFLRWFGVELSAAAGNALYIPAGFAHGLVTLVDETDVYYHISRFYEPAAARGLRWNDPAIGIAWPIVPIVMSDRDRDYPDFDPASFDG